MNRVNHQHFDDDSCCPGTWSQPSLHQTLEELDFERGIWNDACHGDITEIERKLKKGFCTVNSVDRLGYTALHYASRNGHVHTCQTLIARGANVNCQTKSGKSTPLHRAAYCGHTYLVEYLLSKKANPMTQDADGKTALHKAAENGHIKVMHILLSDSPALKTVTDNRGKTAIQYVPHDKKEATIQIFNHTKNDN